MSFLLFVTIPLEEIEKKKKKIMENQRKYYVNKKKIQVYIYEKKFDCVGFGKVGMNKTTIGQWSDRAEQEKTH